MPFVRARSNVKPVKVSDCSQKYWKERFDKSSKKSSSAFESFSTGTGFLFRVWAVNSDCEDETNKNNVNKNQETILENQQEIRNNQKRILDNQEAILNNQEMLNKILSNQEEILSLLKK